MVNWHPLGTIWHPFEGAGTHYYVVYSFIYLSYIYGFIYIKANLTHLTWTQSQQVFSQKPNIIYEPGSKLVVLRMVIPPLIGSPYNGYINPYYWVDEFIPYYMEIMGV